MEEPIYIDDLCRVCRGTGREPLWWLSRDCGCDLCRSTGKSDEHGGAGMTDTDDNPYE